MRISSQDKNFTGFGVKTDGDFHPLRGGEVVSNLYVIGAEVGGCNPLAEGSGAGVAIHHGIQRGG